MSKKPPILKDWVMSSAVHDVDYILRAYKKYTIGRNPPHIKDYRAIRILRYYNPIRHDDDDITQRGLSVSPFQGELHVDKSGLVLFVQESVESPTHILRPHETGLSSKSHSRKFLLEIIPQYLAPKFSATPGIAEQLFPGDLLVFGCGYLLEYMGHIDLDSEKSAIMDLRNAPTQSFLE
jgi:hypothetical protein